MVFLGEMKKKICKYRRNFCESLRDWFYTEYEPRVGRGAVTKAYKAFGISQSYMSGILNGTKFIEDEEKRREIADIIGKKYDEMIGIGEVDSPNTDSQDMVTANIVDNDECQKSEPIQDMLNMSKEILESKTRWGDLLAMSIKNFHLGANDRRQSDRPDMIPGNNDRRKKGR